VRRAALALLVAAVAAALVLGMLTLAQPTSGHEPYDVFTVTLVALLPLVLAAGFSWREASARVLRAVMWTVVGGCLLLAGVPWRQGVLEGAHHHSVTLMIFALAAGAAATLTERSTPLRAWLAADD
jgi:peptidoglycan/LPS O-acetylase OafA/YrhL